MYTSNNSERGQVMVFIVIGFVVLLGFVGLAIDGGMVYSDRRHAQNAADAASLAGGGKIALGLENDHVFYGQWNCDDSKVIQAMAQGQTVALSRAASNGFTLERTITNDNGVIVQCGAFNAGGFVDKYIDVTTHISTTTRTTFSRFLFPTNLVSKVQAVVRVRPRSPLVYGHAVVALNDSTNCNNNTKIGVVFSGSGDTKINGGGVWSNGCLKGTNNSCKVTVTNGDISYVGGRFPGTGDLCQTMQPAASTQPYTLPQDSYSVPLPDCGHEDAITVNSISSNTTLEENKLYCITSSGNAIKITNGTLTGNNVTLFLVNGGDVEISGGTINLSAPAADSPGIPPAIPGVLIYVNPVRDSVINLNGNNDSKYLGLIYAPRADVSFSGANNTKPTFNTQVIGWNVEITGNASIDINFNQGQAYSSPSNLELNK